LGFYRRNGLGLDRCKESDIAVPSETIAVGCSPDRTDGRVIQPTDFNFLPGGWHSGERVNFLFTDSHVELIKSNLIVAASDTARRRWNRDNQPHPETWVTLP
jgi:prepilin-type processing-associated H-X9-DG protein